MKKFTLLFLFMLSFVMLQAQQKETSAADALDKYLTEKYPANEPGATVLVIKNGKTLLRKGYGMANMNPQRPASPDGIYKIGSVTKQFTSTAILKLAQENKLSLQDDISKYFPGFTEKKITIEHLLQHTSGIKSYTSIQSMMTAERKKSGIKQEELLEILKTTPFDFEPGEKYLYNNSGYYLLGIIIEKVSGQKYEDYLSANFFKPLKMKNTFIDDKNLPSQRPVGYNKFGADGFESADYIHPTIPFSAGAIYSTVDDLWKWNQGVFSFKLVKKEWLDKAWTPLTLKNGTQENYGYGWMFNKLNGKKVIGHGGAIDGFLSYESYEPESGIYVCILMNSMKSRPEDYAYDLAQIASGETKNKPTAITLDEKSVQEYIGVYAMNEREQRVITFKDGKLFSKRTGGTAYQIIPFAKDQFFFEDTEATIKFVRDGSGKISSCELDGRQWLTSVAKRTDKPLPVEAKEIELDVAIFDKYVGEYELAPSFKIKVWREENKFKAQATGQQAFDIYAESEKKFFLKVVDAKIEFYQDEKGNTVSMTLFQGGREMPGKKIN